MDTKEQPFGPYCDCQNPEPDKGVALVSMECPVHNAHVPYPEGADLHSPIGVKPPMSDKTTKEMAEEIAAPGPPWFDERSEAVAYAYLELEERNAELVEALEEVFVCWRQAADGLITDKEFHTWVQERSKAQSALDAHKGKI